MDRDILWITRLPNGERMGVSLFSVDLDNSSSEDIRTKRILNNLTSSYEYSLDNVESLPDGDYPISLFKNVPYAAHFVLDGEPTPICKIKPLLRYIGDKSTYD